MKAPFLALLLTTQCVWAFDFQNNIQGAKSNAMGLAYTGMDNNAEVVWLNPALMSSFTTKGILETGIHARSETAVFRYKEPSLYQASTDNPITIAPYLYSMYSINTRFSLGLAINKAFSEQTKWQEENWAGRFILRQYSINSQIIQPALSARITDGLYLGVGVFFVNSQLDMQRALPVRDHNREGNLALKGTGSAVGVNTGLFYRYSDQLNFRINYKSSINISFQDNNPDVIAPVSLSHFFPQDNASQITIQLPAILDISGGVEFTDRMKAAWYTNILFFNDSKTIRARFSQQSNYLNDFSISRNRNSSIVAGLGFSYQANNYLIFRGGSYYEGRNTNKDFFAPVAAGLQKLGLTGGVSFIPISGLYLDLSLIYLNGLQKNNQYLPASFGGTYRSSALIPGFSLGYSF